MTALVELGQLVITLVISGVVAFLVGPAYIAIAVLVMATCLVLLYQAAKTVSSIVGAPPIQLGEAIRVVATALVFGVIWPAIPLILAWKSTSGDGGSVAGGGGR